MSRFLTWPLLPVATSLSAICLSGCQFFFPMPLEPEVESNGSNQAVRTVGAPFEEGEAFYADVFAENVAVGKASFKVGKRCLADGKLVLPVDGSGTMGGLLSFLSSGEAETRALIDLDTNNSLESKWDIAVDDKRTFAELDFAPGRYRIHQRKEDPERDKPTNSYRRMDLPIEQIPHDGHSLLGYLRRWDPAPGTKGFVHTTMGRYLIRADVAFTGEERIQTPMGERNAVRIDGVGVRVSDKTLEPVPRAVPKPFTIWFTADDARIPLRLVVQTDLAELTIDVTRAVKAEISKDAPVECQDRVDKLALGKARGPKKPRAPGEAADPNKLRPLKRRLAPRNVTRPAPAEKPAPAPPAAEPDG
jgi:hypothetical protein